MSINVNEIKDNRNYWIFLGSNENLYDFFSNEYVYIPSEDEIGLSYKSNSNRYITNVRIHDIIALQSEDSGMIKGLGEIIGQKLVYAEHVFQVKWYFTGPIPGAIGLDFDDDESVILLNDSESRQALRKTAQRYHALLYKKR